MNVDKDGNPIDDDEEIIVDDDDTGLDDDDDGLHLDLDEEDDNDAAFNKLDNKAFAAMRKEVTEAKRAAADSAAKIKEYEAQAAQQQQQRQYVPQAPQAPREMYSGVAIPESREEWDALARKDWKLAIDMTTHVENRKAFKHYEQQRQTAVTLEDSKQKVLVKHPELSDASTEKGRIYTQILDENPHYIRDPRGPHYAMRDMEDRMVEQGYTPDQIYTKQSTRTPEASAARANLTSGGKNPQRPRGRSVTLSKDDIEFCKSQDLDPKEYAKQKLEMNQRAKGAQL